MSTVNITVNALNEPLATPAPYVIPVRFTQPDSNVSGVSTPLTIDLHVEVNNDLVQSLAVNGILIAESLEVLNAGFPSTTFIYNSSGDQTGTRYNTWSDLMDAIALIQYGGPRNILFEQNEIIPVGAWDLTNITLLGNGTGYRTAPSLTLIVTIPTGCTFTNSILSIANGITVNSTSANPVMSGHANPNLILSTGATLATENAEFLLCDVNDSINILRVDGGAVANGAGANAIYDAGYPIGGYELIATNPPAYSVSVVLVNVDYGYYSDDLFRTDHMNVDGFMVLVDDFYVVNSFGVASEPGPVTEIAHANLRYTPDIATGQPAPWPSFFLATARSSNVPYTEAVATDWNSNAPLLTNRALDRLAARPLDYTLNLKATTAHNPADTLTYYFGATTTTGTVGSVNGLRTYIPVDGTITVADIMAYAAGGAHTTENWSMYIRVNDTTDTLIATMNSAGPHTRWFNDSLAIAVSAGDYIECKMVCPTWVTNPLNVTYNGHVLIRSTLPVI